MEHKILLRSGRWRHSQKWKPVTQKAERTRFSVPVISHYACIHPPDDTIICRFMDFPKFRDLFANEELYLRRANLFKDDDPWEALPSDEYIRKALSLKRYDPDDEKELIEHQAFSRQHSESCYINCWQIFQGETIHMWNRYGKGAVIFSRFDLLKNQLGPMLDQILIGAVKYSEDETTRYNLIQFLFTKRASFDKEKELRVLLQCYDPLAGMNRQYGTNDYPSREPLDENPLHPWVHPYKRRRIDLKALVTEIRVSPWAAGEEMDEAKLWVENKNFSCPVNASDLTSPLSPTLDDLRKYGG